MLSRASTERRALAAGGPAEVRIRGSGSRWGQGGARRSAQPLGAAAEPGGRRLPTVTRPRELGGWWGGSGAPPGLGLGARGGLR